MTELQQAAASPAGRTRRAARAPALVRSVGVAGGGQLARLMAPAARALDLRLVVLDPDPACAAAGVADELLVGAYDSLFFLRALADRCDVVTFEIERVDADGLRRLQGLGQRVMPSAEVLETIQDKLLQKHFMRMHGIPTAAFGAWSPEREEPLPFVWKARRGGYDGRGVAVVHDAAARAALPQVPAMAEELVDIVAEFAILVARDASGQVEFHPLVDLVMDDRQHVMDMVVAPSAAASGTVEECRRLAAEIVAGLDYTGILAVEFLLDRGGRVLVNEISPRPHNSGHYTIEACNVSQFEQHLRAVAGLGLRPVELARAAVTFNVLGSPGAHGTPRYVGFDEAARSPDVHIHCYDKAEVRPGRKMAHVTVLGASRQQALDAADALKARLQVVAADD